MTKVTLFAQTARKLEKNLFNRLVREKSTDKYQKGFNGWTHLVSMLFCQLAGSRSVKATVTHQIIYRNFRECSHDTDLGSYDYHSSAQSAQGNDQIWMTFSGGFYQAEPLCQNRLVGMVGQTL